MADQVLVGPGYRPHEPRWVLVRIRLGGRWQLAVLRDWSRCDGAGGRWMAYVEWAPVPRAHERAYGWFWYHPDVLQELELPQGREPMADGGSPG